MFHFRQVIVRMRLGESDRAVSKTGLMGRRKLAEVRRVAQEQGWLNADSPLPDDTELAKAFTTTATPTPVANSSVSQVESYRDEVQQWYEQGVTGTAIHQALIRKYHFQGSYSAIRRFLKGLEKDKTAVTSVIDFAPGDSAQVDFGQGPKIMDALSGELIKTWVFVMVLSWSRHQYAEIVRDQTVETCIIDNPKFAITRACYHDPQVQRAYADCAEGYGFLIAPCPVRDPKKKGRVESGVKYIKNNFMPLRQFRSLVDANEQLKKWILEVAGNRLHGTVQEKPYSRFIEVEKVLLKPLPDIAPRLASWTTVKVHGDCHVQLEKCRYSVPFRWVGKQLWLRATDTLVELFYEQQLITAHKRLKKPGQRVTVADHLPPQAKAYRMRDPQWCLQQSKKIGPQCTALIEHLFADRVLDNLRAAQGIVGLKKSYGAVRLEAACQRALAFNNPRYQTIKSILHQGLDQQPQTEDLFDQLSDTYQGKGRFCRDTRKLFYH